MYGYALCLRGEALSDELCLLFDFDMSEPKVSIEKLGLLGHLEHSISLSGIENF